MQHDYDYLIVGAGMAADAAARALREVDAAARIGLVGAEAEAPYDRPPLSKALWKPGHDADSVDRGTVAATGATLHLGRRAVRLDTTAHRVEDERGERYTYRKLLLATGGAPRALSFGGERVLSYRTLPDYRRLRALAQPDAHIAVVGGGFIGSELAASLRGAGCRVSLVFPEAVLGERVFPAALARHIDACYRERGVALHPGERVAGGRADAQGVQLTLASGASLAADAVVAGLGIVPDVALAEAGGLAVDNGIVVDAYLRSSAPDVYAAGDVASFRDAVLGLRRRVEHEDNALQMGRAAARNMAGLAEPWTHLPFFYSDLFDFGYEAVGLLDARLETVADWVVPLREGAVYYLDDGRVRGALLWNLWGQTEHARALLAERGPHDAESLRGRLPR